MKTKLEQVLERCLNGREIAVWGTPTRLMLRALSSYKFHIAGKVDPAKHYVVAVNDDDLTDFFMDEQSKPFKFVDDYLTFYDFGGELPFEWDCYGAKIGRQTYFSDGIVRACKEGYIKNIGHFTSINGTVEMANDHQHNMIFQSDDISDFFTESNKNLFVNQFCTDPKRPYQVNQRLLTIGNDVWIGANVFINCSKVTTIGDGAIIGSGAVVLEDVPPYGVVVGVPAKIKRYRFEPDMIETLLRVKWWDWSIDEINANADALISPDLFIKRFGNK